LFANLLFAFLIVSLILRKICSERFFNRLNNYNKYPCYSYCRLSIRSHLPYLFNLDLLKFTE
jgi:hypothetical protein